MSLQIENMTERELRMGILKLAVTLTVGLLIVAFVLSLLIQSEDPLARIPIGALLIAVAVSILANGVLAMLKIVDWFEERRARREQSATRGVS